VRRFLVVLRQEGTQIASYRDSGPP